MHCHQQMAGESWAVGMAAVGFTSTMHQENQEIHLERAQKKALQRAAGGKLACLAIQHRSLFNILPPAPPFKVNAL